MSSCSAHRSTVCNRVSIDVWRLDVESGARCWWNWLQTMAIVGEGDSKPRGSETRGNCSTTFRSPSIPSGGLGSAKGSDAYKREAWMFRLPVDVCRGVAGAVSMSFPLQTVLSERSNNPPDREAPDREAQC